jgi:hypothetical protein
VGGSFERGGFLPGHLLSEVSVPPSVPAVKMPVFVRTDIVALVPQLQLEFRHCHSVPVNPSPRLLTRLLVERQPNLIGSERRLNGTLDVQHFAVLGQGPFFFYR